MKKISYGIHRSYTVFIETYCRQFSVDVHIV